MPIAQLAEHVIYIISADGKVSHKQQLCFICTAVTCTEHNIWFCTDLHEQIALHL